jgi:hypothetical protein
LETGTIDFSFKKNGINFNLKITCGSKQIKIIPIEENKCYITSIGIPGN